jgi:hypothetical protein
MSSFPEGAAKTLTLSYFRGFSFIFRRDNGAGRTFNFERRENSKSCNCTLGDLRRAIGFLFCQINKERTVAFTISE